MRSQRVLLERISMVGQHDVGRGHVLQRRAKIGNQRRDVVDGACAGHDKVLRKPRQRVGNTFSASGDGPSPPATIVIHCRAEIETTGAQEARLDGDSQINTRVPQGAIG